MQQCVFVFLASNHIQNDPQTEPRTDQSLLCPSRGRVSLLESPDAHCFKKRQRLLPVTLPDGSPSLEDISDVDSISLSLE